MRDSHRADAERLLARAVEEEVRRSGGRTDGKVLLSRARGALDTMARTAAEEYEAYTRALDDAAAGQLTFRQRYAREGAGTPLLVAGVAGATAVVTDLFLGTGTGTALGAGVAVGMAGAAATVVKVVGAHVPAAHHRAGAVSQPGGPEQLRLQWLTALEVRGIRPFLDQQRMLAASTGPQQTGPRLRGADKSAAARGRNVLEQSFGQLPQPVGTFAGRRREMAQIRQWVQAARATTRTLPTVVVLHGAPGSGRTTLAVRAAHDLKDYFRGACVVDLRADSPGEAPLSTRDALLHLLNRLGAPREQLLFRERSSPDQQVGRLSELYHQHVTGMPVTVVLDDAADPQQVRTLLPERSDSLVLVTSRAPLRPAGRPAGPGPPAAGGGARPGGLGGAPGRRRAGLVRALRRRVRRPDPGTVRRAAAGAADRRFLAGCALAACAGLGPERLRPGRPGRARPVAALHRPAGDTGRRLLRRLALAGRVSLGAAAAAAVLGTDEAEARRHLEALSRTGLLTPVRQGRYRLHDLVRAFALARLLDEEDPAERAAAQERLIVNYAELADSVLRLVDGNMSNAGPLRPVRLHVAGRGAALAGRRVELHHGGTAARGGRRPEGGAEPPRRPVRLLPAARRPVPAREINELAQAVDEGLLVRSVQWRTGIAARQLGELDKARTTLTSVVGPVPGGASRRGGRAGPDLAGHHAAPPGQSDGGVGAAAGGDGPAACRAPAGHRPGVDDARAGRGGTRPGPAVRGPGPAHRVAGAAPRGRVRARPGVGALQLGQLNLRMGDVPRAETVLRTALELYGRTRDARGEAWALPSWPVPG
ncbi:hypothetical protein SHIRM173S_04720 [Streptomyces hirsutus]